MTNIINHDEPGVEAAGTAIEKGDVEALKALLEQYPQIARCKIKYDDVETSLLHCATDWPGHYPNVGESIRMLAGAGADVNVRMVGAHAETPLLYAASSNDVKAIDALVEMGADLEMDGSVTDGGTALDAAVNFGNLDAARRLVEHGAKTKLFTISALGMKEEVAVALESNDYSQGSLDYSFWCACASGEIEVLELLLANGAQINHLASWDTATPLDEAIKNNQEATISWLNEHGAKLASDL